MGKVFLIVSESLGRGPEELGRALMGSMLRKLWAEEAKPDTIVFYNSAVKLLAPGSPVLDALTGLSEAGVDLVACGTCVAYFQLKDLQAGRVSNMQEIVSLLVSADRVVTP